MLAAVVYFKFQGRTYGILGFFGEHSDIDVFLTVHHTRSIDLFQVTNLMHSSFIL